MSIEDPDVRDHLLSYFDENDEEEDESTMSYGNLTVVSLLSFALVGGLVYYTSESKTSDEFNLGLGNEEFEETVQYIEHETNEE